jgi:hypothetical protein
LKTPDSNVLKYLNKYSIKGIELVWNPDDQITSAVVIPAIQEYENIRKLLSSLIKNDSKYFVNTIFIFVINNLPSSSLIVKEDNIGALELLKSIIDKTPKDNFADNILKSGLKIGYIDASSPGKELSEKEGGVGLARKIGLDAAIRIFNYAQKERAKLLICLDADCTVKENYLTEIHRYFYKNNIEAASIYFEHMTGNQNNDNSAIICYETFLRYYVMGLRYAGSSYAFHTIGSAMACNHDIYIKTEGMNKKKAAEDFYFLEKISKHTEIHNIKTTAVYPSERKSWRVPFGTGQRITRFHAKTHEEYFLYDPNIFDILKEWLYIFHSGEILSAEIYLKHGKSICKGLHEFLLEQNFKLNFTAILKSSKSDMQIKKQQFRWFDGFKTLKLIHFLRDNYFPNINMYEALDNIFAKCDITGPSWVGDDIPSTEIQLQYLEKLRILDCE